MTVKIFHGNSMVTKGKTGIIRSSLVPVPALVPQVLFCPISFVFFCMIQGSQEFPIWASCCDSTYDSPPLRLLEPLPTPFHHGVT
jgi:hypothetical protein